MPLIHRMKLSAFNSNSQTTIDNILENFPLYNCISKIVIENISDHFPIFLQTPINYDKLNIKSKQFRLNNIHCKNKFIEFVECMWMFGCL